MHLVFSHTRLRGPDLTATAATLVCFSIGMFGWGAQNILARGFYSTHDTITPAVVGTAMTVLGLPVYWVLVHHLQHLGLALASSILISVYTVLLYLLLVRRTKDQHATELLWFLAKVTAASAAAGVVTWKFAAWLNTHISWRTPRGAFVDLCLATAVGLILTVALAWLLRVRELNRYLGRFASALGVNNGHL